MRLQELAARLVVVETKLATLTGAEVDHNNPSSIEELDKRLSVVEVTVDHLISEKTKECIAAIVTAPADASLLSVDEVVALSPSASTPEAAEIVADVVATQIETAAIDNPEVAVIVTAAVAAVVKSDPEVVADPEAIKAAITEAVSHMPAPSAESEVAAAAAVAEVVAAATGREVTPDVHSEIVAAVVTPSDPKLDEIEARLVKAEEKVESLLGK